MIFKFWILKKFQTEMAIALCAALALDELIQAHLGLQPYST